MLVVDYLLELGEGGVTDLLFLKGVLSGTVGELALIQ